VDINLGLYALAGMAGFAAAFTRSTAPIVIAIEIS
jgi:H+/Cl- antiporter ClcA